MERIDLFQIYKIATEIHPLTTLSGDMPTFDVALPAVVARGAISGLLGDVPPIRIEISRAAAHDVLAVIEDLAQRYWTDPETGKWNFPSPDVKVLSWDVSRLNKAAENFEIVFRAEMNLGASYAVPRRGLYDTASLVDQAESCLPPALIPHAGAEAAADIKAAGRCFAFGLFTAAGYHVCRAVESLMIKYHGVFSTARGGNVVWNDYIEDLDKAAKGGGSPCPDKRTIHNLRHLKNSTRNPLMHPRITLDETDAHVLMNEGIAAMIRMAQEVETAAGGVQLRLTGLQSVAPAVAAPAAGSGT